MKQICHFFLLATLIVLMNASFSQQVYLSQFASGFTDPVDIANAGDPRLFIVEQAGKIKIVDAQGNVNTTPFLDITSMASKILSEKYEVHQYGPDSGCFANFLLKLIHALMPYPSSMQMQCRINHAFCKNLQHLNVHQKTRLVL